MSNELTARAMRAVADARGWVFEISAASVADRLISEALQAERQRILDAIGRMHEPGGDPQSDGWNDAMTEIRSIVEVPDEQ